ncbi:MAG: NAD(P)-dependent oxidoreductase [Deltaproteobacteria bacterium]|nr:NAD(P)-dependent oxidoreductase [Deltaproteobacteria bacterium]
MNTASSKTLRFGTDAPLGWIGTGIVGLSMCSHLLRYGHRLTVFNRTRAKAQPLLDKGASWAESPREVAANSTVVFTMVGFPEDVRQVYLEEHGILSGARPGSIVVDMTTSTPSLAREIYRRAQAAGVQAVDAPVSGGDVGAREAALSIMVGGDREAVEAIRPLLAVMGKQVVHQGGPGAGQHTKMCNQIVIAGTMIGVCESLLYGYKAGLDLEKMLRSVSSGAAACGMLTNLAPRILRRDFDPGFFVDHFVKDMAIALEEARRLQLSLPGLALVQQLYLAVKAQGHGKLGTQALILALEQLCSTEISSPPATLGG